MEWSSLLGTLIPLLIGAVGGMLTKSGRLKAKADAFKAMEEAFNMRIADLTSSIHRHNEDEKRYSERISELNGIIDDKTARIRELSGKIWDAEQETNRVNDKLNTANERITALTEERDKYRNWHCRKADCSNRVPPNPTLAGQTFN